MSRFHPQAAVLACGQNMICFPWFWPCAASVTADPLSWFWWFKLQSFITDCWQNGKTISVFFSDGFGPWPWDAFKDTRWVLGYDFFFKHSASNSLALIVFLTFQTNDTVLVLSNNIGTSPTQLVTYRACPSSTSWTAV